MTLPTISVRVAFTTDPTAATTWTDLTNVYATLVDLLGVEKPRYVSAESLRATSRASSPIALNSSR